MEETLQLSTRLAELARVDAALMGMVGRGLPPDTAAEARLVMEEVFTNIVKHAHPPGGGEHPVCVRLAVRAGWLEIEVVDDGCAFDPLAHTDDELAKPFRQRAEGRMGIPILRALVDECSYWREGGRNHLLLRKRLQDAL